MSACARCLACPRVFAWPPPPSLPPPTLAGGQPQPSSQRQISLTLQLSKTRGAVQQCSIHQRSAAGDWSRSGVARTASKPQLPSVRECTVVDSRSTVPGMHGSYGSLSLHVILLPLHAGELGDCPHPPQGVARRSWEPVTHTGASPSTACRGLLY